MGRYSKELTEYKLESKFQSHVICRLKTTLEDCIILKQDSSYIQGIPDLLVLYKDSWFSLEVKRSEKAPKRPNQEYWVNKMNEMSFSRFISPENEEEVFNDIQQAFKS